ncbi:hypothetical protein C8J45_102231 [Sphingomonas sp. PP-CE-3G-477]|uniref:hypothetical protein n=1 Tax=Sphingomonas sp. PP-CE-3G-477 TaxID=2135660 RepID=UPI000D39CD7A|nr:hypothetical protein [Sphingomonas sp. PP-CE-3G-477]PTQ64875.1 hypothetical protein C8J45_102231 [Sphingomonas sp. PP-CE-3G-477]
MENRQSLIPVNSRHPFRSAIGIAGHRLRNSPAALWLARFYYAQHNAGVLVDMEYRFGVVLDEATNGRISKPYYAVETMVGEICEARAEREREAYQDGRRDALEEHDLLDDDVDGEPA